MYWGVCEEGEPLTDMSSQSIATAIDDTEESSIPDKQKDVIGQSYDSI
jgi:hypothetical protein